jgi:hypothetical protein
MEVICFQAKEAKEDQRVARTRLNQTIAILKSVNNKILGEPKREEEAGQKEQKIGLIQWSVALNNFKFNRNL